MEASLVFKSSDGTQVGRVNGFSESDVAKVKQMISDVAVLEDKVVISTADPSGGTSGQLWFKYEA